VRFLSGVRPRNPIGYRPGRYPGGLRRLRRAACAVPGG
jgi:hypothetical protein